MKFSTGLAALVVAMAGSQAAHAANELIQNTDTATAICQGALPAFETSLRKRPLGIGNEGQQNAFISCSFTTSNDGSNGTAIVAYHGGFFTNSTNADTTVTCTSVRGLAGEPDNEYETRSVTVLANGVPGTPDTGYIFFGPAEGEPLHYQNVTMSCALPPGISLNDTYVGYYTDDATAAPN